jgi:hypothetical protein
MEEWRKMESYRTRKMRGVFLYSTLFVFVMSNFCLALVLHPDHEPDTSWTNRPADDVVGRWSTNASCVAISPNYILTVRHAGGGVGSSVYFGDVAYVVREVWNEPADDGKAADLRVCRIEKASGGPANLSDYVGLYTSSDEARKKKNIVTGGYGKGRGAGIPDDVNPVGYSWSGSTNQMLRWGQNQIEDAVEANTGTYISSTLTANFDEPGAAGSATEYEAAIAAWDSGCGWFIFDGEQWKLAGIGAYVEHADASYFNPPDFNMAVRVSSYDDWIESVLVEPECSGALPGDVNGDCQINFSDLETLLQYWLAEDCDMTNDFCGGADLAEPYGKIDMADYVALVSQWYQCNLVPEWGCE